MLLIAWHLDLLDLGLVEFGVLDQKERLRRYRRHVYEAGAVNRSDNIIISLALRLVPSTYQVVDNLEPEAGIEDWGCPAKSL